MNDAEIAVPSLLAPDTASLVRELAQDIRLPADILPDYGFSGIDDPKYLALANTPEFKTLLREAVKEWQTADSTPKRIRYKGLAALEMTIPELYVIAMTDKSSANRLDAIKALRDIAGFGNNGINSLGANGGGGSGTTFNINIGQRTIQAVIRPNNTIEGTAEEES